MTFNYRCEGCGFQLAIPPSRRRAERRAHWRTVDAHEAACPAYQAWVADIERAVAEANELLRGVADRKVIF